MYDIRSSVTQPLVVSKDYAARFRSIVCNSLFFNRKYSVDTFRFSLLQSSFERLM